jgi:hypothetical protein
MLNKTNVWVYETRKNIKCYKENVTMRIKTYVKKIKIFKKIIRYPFLYLGTNFYYQYKNVKMHCHLNEENIAIQ